MNTPQVIIYRDKHFPRLNDKSKNPAKIWEIRYYLYNPTTGKYEKQRKSISPTSRNKANYDKRFREAKSIIADFKKRMNEGWHIEPKITQNASITLPTEKILEEAIKEYILSKKGQDEMTKAIKAVVSSMRKHSSQILTKPLSQVNKQDCLAYKTAIKKVVSAATCNYYMRVFSCFFNYALENEWIAQNPCKGIKPLRTEDSSSNFPFTPAQRQAILDKALELGEEQLYLLCQFMYFTLARPYEDIQMLKVGNIREKEIFYPAGNAKSGKSCAVPIAPSLEAIIQTYKLRDYPAEHYVFGKEGKPSGILQTKRFYITHRKILENLKLTNLDDKRYTLYSHKPTGVIALAQRAKNYQDLVRIQKMCRHENIEETEGYLRKMGVNISLDDTSILV